MSNFPKVSIPQERTTGDWIYRETGSNPSVTITITKKYSTETITHTSSNQENNPSNIAFVCPQNNQILTWNKNNPIVIGLYDLATKTNKTIHTMTFGSFPSPIRYGVISIGNEFMPDFDFNILYILYQQVSTGDRRIRKINIQNGAIISDDSVSVFFGSAIAVGGPNFGFTGWVDKDTLGIYNSINGTFNVDAKTLRLVNPGLNVSSIAINNIQNYKVF